MKALEIVAVGAVGLGALLFLSRKGGELQPLQVVNNITPAAVQGETGGIPAQPATDWQGMLETLVSRIKDMQPTAQQPAPTALQPVINIITNVTSGQNPVQAIAEKARETTQAATGQAPVQAAISDAAVAAVETGGIPTQPAEGIKEKVQQAVDAVQEEIEKGRDIFIPNAGLEDIWRASARHMSSTKALVSLQIVRDNLPDAAQTVKDKVGAIGDTVKDNLRPGGLVGTILDIKKGMDTVAAALMIPINPGRFADLLDEWRQ